MRKKLSEMTLEELWELFPIFLVAHDDRWKDSFNEIGKTLTGLLSDRSVDRLSHIGSTAIQGIWAKEYEALKFRLWKQYEHNRDAYTDAKTDFISGWTAEARKEYGDRY